MSTICAILSYYLIYFLNLSSFWGGFCLVLAIKAAKTNNLIDKSKNKWFSNIHKHKILILEKWRKWSFIGIQSVSSENFENVFPSNKQTLQLQYVQTPL